MPLILGGLSGLGQMEKALDGRKSEGDGNLDQESCLNKAME